MRRLVIIGTSETSERILKFCQLYELFDVVGFAVDREYKKNDMFHQLPVWDIETLDTHINKEEDLIFVALFWNHLNRDRRQLFERLKSKGFHSANIVSPKASVRGVIGENCWIMDNVIIQEGACIGDNVIIADNALIGNMSKIKNHCFCGANSTVMGGVVVGEQSFLGNCSSILEGVHVGRKCLIGAVTFVKEDLNDFTMIKTDVSNTIKQYSESEIEMKMIARYKAKLREKKTIDK